ncbi:MAG: hypothetical protein COT34_00665 [Candidatus Nealsonbacteria bacterium CG08_land_8_20_14_0_20_43_11]|uniref:Single-stranded-DNA-specific exonuclease RecJ n=1 Tax=Candidatus Nealsonbacteria bacterium CG08_land_8_20_14_0_20_43_11 TaxID=1974706 RepID=A0A2M6T1F2_9BACT|nr:MAG: hypothetical protein COT34_00665 [Candidatus Nealsonbacteria bacterium CG08_land_8_20_14_0_20_43_11]
MAKEIKNLRRVSQRILKAIKEKEKIILYGDADLDGLASVIMLRESIKSLNAETAAIYFPDRQKEGYGLNFKALNYLKKQAPALLIVLDCGISNFAEAEKAEKMGFDLIIIDHHEVLDKLPKASIVVDPKRKDDQYPFKRLAAAGIVFRLTKLLFGRKFSPKLKESFTELTALATVADMMPNEAENRPIISQGLSTIKRTFRPGLKVLWEKYDSGHFEMEVFQKVISALNFSGVNHHLLDAYYLLTVSSEKEAKKIAGKVLRKNRERQQRVREIVAEISERIAENPAGPIVFEIGRGWETILLGSIASKICREYHKPTFIIRKDASQSRGAVRMLKGFNGVEALKTCADYLITFGGHPMAAGFAVENKNLEKLEKDLNKYFKKL